MSRTTTAASLSFKPWNRDQSDATTLKDVLARVNLERGHFRDITEASLQEEIAAEGALELSSSDGEGEDQNEKGANSTKRKAPTSREELYATKREMLEHVGAAHQDVMMSLDFIALLESKHAHSQGAVSMSAGLKQAGVLPGSLGTDIWDPKAIPVDTARQAQDDLLASTVRMESLQHCADDLLAAATRLQDNVRKETVFWDQILTVSERGWSVSKIYRHLLGVHFGFRGSGADFAHRNVAALISDLDGNIALERGIGTKPKAMRVVMRRAHAIVGSSTLPKLPDHDETTLDARIRHARDSVYDEELFHEMIREARTLTSTGITIQGATIGFATGSRNHLRVELELVSLDEDNALPTEASHELDVLAEGALLIARLLLGHEHRTRLNQKKRLPQPMVAKKGEDSDERKFIILCSLMLLFRHHSEVSEINMYLDHMSKLLTKAQAPVECESARMALATASENHGETEFLVESLTHPITSEGRLTIIPSEGVRLDITITIETSRFNSIGSLFILQAPGVEKVEFSSMQDVLAAADDFIGLALAHVLRSLLGEEWALDPRGGSLSRPSVEEQQDILWFVVDNVSQAITLRSGGATNGKEIRWTLDSTGGNSPLKEAWQDILG